MDFRLLGQLEADHHGRRVELGRRRERCLLGVMLLEAGAVVAVDRLLELLWDEDPPPSARANLHTHVSRLRTRLDPDDDGQFGVRLLTRGGGYLAEVDRRSVDAHGFRSLVEHADGLPDPAARSDLLRQALALWRGPILADVASPRLRERIGAGLTELRLAATERLIDAELACGRHESILGELAMVTAEHPHRERFTGQLMLALHRSGRHPDALDTYQRYRDRLADDLGVDPGPELRRLHAGILRDDPALAAPARAEGTRPTLSPEAPKAAVPRQLPPDIASFTGRDSTLHLLDQVLDRPEAASVVISAIAGIGGLGKTALAVHWARRVADRFPHGQLYVDLRGCSADRPMSPVEALSLFLQALGAPEDNGPADQDALVGRYRSLLADRRILVILDNALDAEQVRPLLPGSAGSVVVVTTRNDLRGLVALNDARLLSLDVLTPEESVALLTRVLGVDRLRAERAAAEDLAALCGYLPLALRIAAANLACSPGRAIAKMVEELRCGDRLGALSSLPDPRAAVRTVFDHSYGRLPLATRRVFRLLGIVPADDLTVPAVAALADRSPAEVRSALAGLGAAHLVQPVDQDRLRLHDLVRLYAAECAEREETPDSLGCALDRLFAFYTDTVDAAAATLYPHLHRLPYSPAVADRKPAGRAAALAWLDAEHHNLIAAIHHTARHGPHRTACLLNDALRGYRLMRRHGTDSISSVHAGLDAAYLHGDRLAQAAMHTCVASAHLAIGDYEPAAHHFTESLAAHRDLGAGPGEAAALGNLSTVHRIQGQIDRSLEYATQAREVYRRIGSRRGEAVALGNLGQAHQDLGQLQRALDDFAESLTCFRDTGNREGEANSHNSLGGVFHELGCFDRAAESLDRALAIFRDIGARWGEATTLDSLAALHSDQGRPVEALEEGRLSLAMSREVKYRRTEAAALNTIAVACRRLDRIDDAVHHHTEALSLARELGHRHAEIEALLGLSAASCRFRRAGEALAHAATGLRLATTAGYRVFEGRALTAVAGGHLVAGDVTQAVAHCRQALAVHQATGYRLGELRTLRILAEARDAGDPDGAERARRRARTLAAELGIAGRADEERALEPSG